MLYVDLLPTSISSGTVDRLKVIYAEGGEKAMDDGVAEVRQICISVEEVLRHQQKGGCVMWVWLLYEWEKRCSLKRDNCGVAVGRKRVNIVRRGFNY